MTKIHIVGAGPGGLTAGMILANHGHDVTILEKESEVGGRNGSFSNKGFKFDLGPTFLMLKPVLDEIFKEAGVDIDKYLEFYELDPMYHLVFENKDIKISPNHQKTRESIKKVFPGEEKGFDALLEKESKRFEAAFDCLSKDYSKFYKLFNPSLLKFLPKLSFPNSMYQELGKYFKSEDLKMAFTFQSKYLGMSPWECPAAFMIIPYIEHHFGIQHVKGGLSEISIAMKKVFLKNNGKLELNTEVAKIEDNLITLKTGQKIKTEKIIINADVGYAYKNLLGKNNLENKKYSCSTFMMYLGIDTKVDSEFHTILFSKNYRKYVEDIFNSKTINPDISLYLRNASTLDPTLAPKNQSSLYVLVPVPNNTSKINWKAEKNKLRNLVIEKINKHLNIDLEKHIVTERIVTPDTWENKLNVFQGATFNLAHSLNQILYFRPHNQLSENQYLVGGGTNPGSGLATIYQSGKIVADLINKK